MEAQLPRGSSFPKPTRTRFQMSLRCVPFPKLEPTVSMIRQAYPAITYCRYGSRFPERQSLILLHPYSKRLRKWAASLRHHQFKELFQRSSQERLLRAHFAFPRAGDRRRTIPLDRPSSRCRSTSWSRCPPGVRRVRPEGRSRHWPRPRQGERSARRGGR